MPFLLSQKQTLMPPVPLSLCKPLPNPRSTEQFLCQVILTVNLPGARNTEEASLWREALLRSHSVRGNVQSHSGFIGPSLYTEPIVVRHVVHECASWSLYCLFLLLLVSPMQGPLALVSVVLPGPGRRAVQWKYWLKEWVGRLIRDSFLASAFPTVLLTWRPLNICKVNWGLNSPR